MRRRVIAAAPAGVSLPTLAFAAAVSQAEGSSGTTAFTFTLNLTRNGVTSAVPFTWAVTGTGTNPASASDFAAGVLPSGSGTFATGETTKSIVVNVAGDSNVEPDEGFTVTASASLPIASATAAGTILNDDVAPLVTYLPALTTSGATYHAVYSAERLLSGYAGPLLRTNDGTTATDLGAGATGVTAASVQSLRGSATDVNLDTAYNQAGGSATDATQATAGARPKLHEEALIGGKVSMIFADQTAIRSLGATHALSRTDCTIFIVMDSTTSAATAGFWEYYTGGNYDLFQFSNSSQSGGKIAIWNDGGGTYTSKFLPACPTVVALQCSSTGTTLWLNGQKFDGLAAMPAKAMTTMVLGALDPSLAGGFQPYWRCGGFAAVDKALLDADVAAVSGALMTRFAIPTDYDAVVAIEGTSRDRGACAINNNGFNRAFYERSYFAGKSVQVFNFAEDGQALSTAYGLRASHTGAVYRADRRFVLVIDDAINDLHGNGASSDPTTIYSTTFGGWLSYARGLGSNVRVLFGTTLPSYGYASDTDRGTINGLLVANSLGADGVAQPTTDSLIGPSPNDTTYYPDSQHLTAAGNKRWATYSGPVLTAALA